jgi:mannan endo-1,4-beta-mannosidase
LQQWVEHKDGFTMSYGNPQNSDYVNSRIKLVRQHLTKMSSGKSLAADAALPEVACPAVE